jgi:hypothetical protein
MPAHELLHERRARIAVELAVEIGQQRLELGVGIRHRGALSRAARCAGLTRRYRS